MKPLRNPAVIILLLMLSMIVTTRSQSLPKAPEIAGLDYCDLIRHAAAHHKKRVRIRAIYVLAFEASFLYKSECCGKGADENRVWVEFDPSFEQSSKAEVIRRFDDLLKPSPRKSDGSVDIVDARRVEVVFVGRFESDTSSDVYGHLGGYDYQITVDSIEEVKPLPKDAPW